MFEEKNLLKTERNEVQGSFEKFNKIFSLAENCLSNDYSYDDYVRGNGMNEEKISELPQELRDLVVDFPGIYYLVYRIDRRSNYYSEGTREKSVGLSTVKRKTQTDDAIREIVFKETDPIEGKKRLMIVSESVNEKSFEHLNLADDDKADQPHGEVKIEFELLSDHKKRMRSFSSNRLDEAFFEWNGQQKPVRWVRNLSMDNLKNEVEYNDLYIIGRNHEGSDERAGVKIKIKGDISSPSSINIEIGIGSLSEATILYEDESLGIKITSYKPYPSYKNQMEILKHDPNYSFLFNSNPDINEIIATIQAKIKMLRDDWRSPQAIFSSGLQLEHKKNIENS